VRAKLVWGNCESGVTTTKRMRSKTGEERPELERWRDGEIERWRNAP
jgi:hypothetical protein